MMFSKGNLHEVQIKDLNVLMLKVLLLHINKQKKKQTKILRPARNDGIEPVILSGAKDLS